MRIRCTSPLNVESLDAVLRFWIRLCNERWDIDYVSFASPIAELIDWQLGWTRADWHCLMIEPTSLTAEFEEVVAQMDAPALDRLIVVVLPAQHAKLWPTCAAIDAIVGAHVIDAAQAATQYHCEALHDSRFESMPYSVELRAAVATALFRHIFTRTRLAGTPVKMLAVDADCTLWDGVASEDHGSALSLRERNLQLQRFLLQKKSEGILLALCTSNDPADVINAFGRLPMQLTLEDFSVTRMNHAEKSSNLISIASEIGIGLSSMVFIDDNPAVCHKVRFTTPQITTVLFSDDSAMERLRNLWSLDQQFGTAEDHARARMYAEARLRNVPPANRMSRADYFRSIEQVVVVRQAGNSDFARVAQLTQRCNRFHSTAVRWQVRDLVDHIARGGICYIAELSDRFGNLGMVGVLAAHQAEQDWHCDMLVLSCRAFGRHVEHCLVGGFLTSVHPGEVRFGFADSGGNRVAARFFESMRIPTPTAAGTHSEWMKAEVLIDRLTPVAYGFAPARGFDDVAGNVENDARQMTFLDPDGGYRARLLERICELWYAKIINESAITGGFSDSCTTSLVNTVCAAMASVLQLDRLESHDDFFELGGDSLRAVELLLDLEAKVGATLPITILFDTPFNPTDLAARIAGICSSRASDAPSLWLSRSAGA